MDFSVSLPTYFVVSLRSAICIFVGQLVDKHRDTFFFSFFFPRGRGGSISWKLLDNAERGDV